MTRKILILFAFCLSIFLAFRYLENAEAQTGATPISGRFYRFETVAEVGQNNITFLNPDSSINDSGTVALTGAGALGFNDQQIFLRSPNEALRAITNTSSQTGVFRRFSEARINNANQVVSMATVSPGVPEADRWDGNAVESRLLLATHNDFQLFGNAGINNAGQSTFCAYEHGNTNHRIVTGIRPNFNVRAEPGMLNPAIADNGNVLLRADTATAPIQISNFTLTTATDIALINATNFSVLGNSPGISDDGEVIAFYGELTAAGAANLQTTPGPGIFASIDIGGGTRRIIRLANRQVERLNPPAGTTGNNGDGVCDDPAERAICINGELGIDATGNAVFLNSFSPNSRIGVIHQPANPAGIEGDTIVVSFLGTPNAASPGPPPQYFSNQEGLWTIRVDFKMEAGVIREKPSRPVPVIQLGDNLGSRTVDFISLNDSIARARTNDLGVARTDMPGDHRIAFGATASDGTEIVVRATQIDNDQDGLYDHWETSGIDFDQNGTIDLPLQQAPFNSTPKRKDR